MALDDTSAEYSVSKQHGTISVYSPFILKIKGGSQEVRLPIFQTKYSFKQQTIELQLPLQCIQ